MEILFRWAPIGVGVVVAALGAAVARPYGGDDRRAGEKWFVVLAAAMGAVFLYLLTLPSEKPVFSAGGRLGYGILIGGLLGAFAGIWPVKMRQASAWASGVATAGLSALALTGVALTFLLFKDYPQPALGGFIIGSLASSTFFRLVLPSSRWIDLWAVSSLTLAATASLAAYRYDTISTRFWWNAPLLILAGVIVAAMASSGLSGRSRGVALPALIASVFTLGLTAVFAWKLFPEWPLLWVAAAGIGTYALVTWLSGPASTSTQAASGMALLVMALAAVGFRLLGGFGIGIGMLAAWAVMLPAFASAWRSEADDGNDLVYAMFIGIGVLFIRLMLEVYPMDLRGLDLRDHYTFVAVALGAVFPFVMSSAYPVSFGRGIFWRLASAAVLGIFAAASPLLIVAVWGYKAVLGFLVGTVASMIFLLFINSGALKVKEEGYGRSAVLVTIAQASTVILSGLVGPLAEGPRMTKVIVLASVVVLGLIWSVISTLVSRRGLREEA